MRKKIPPIFFFTSLVNIYSLQPRDRISLLIVGRKSHKWHRGCRIDENFKVTLNSKKCCVKLRFLSLPKCYTVWKMDTRTK
uniref:Uncharacterized protein n=1 Tax=Pararge aegeria TaxID=116150 RepID=S4NVF3_9NEOP